MTETEWLACANPTPMLRFLEGRTSDRKLRLFACACCYRSLLNFYYPELEEAVQWGERFADGLVKIEESETAMGGVIWALGEPADSLNCLGEAVACLLGIPFNSAVAERVVLELADAHHIAEVGTSPKEEVHAQCDLIRDIYGNPLRFVALDPFWLTSNVVSLATGIYQDRAFERLPILADALQDVGCDSDDLLNHLRGDGPHVLGCWALDLVLGKS